MPSLFAIDSANLVVLSSSNSTIVGNGVINNSDTPNGTVFTYSAGGGTTVEIQDTGGSPDTFEDDNTAGHQVIDGGGIVANGTGVEAESRIEIRALDGDGNQTGPTITITVFSQNGNFSDVWGFSSDIALQDGVSYVKTGGSNTGSSAYTSFITCFAQGTEIKTGNGLCPVEDILPGQLVWTRDSGLMPVNWVGCAEVEATGAFAPVVFSPGSLGNSSELVVSQQHRMLLSGYPVELLFGTSDALIAAKHLCGLPGVALRPGGRIRYHHLMFAQHEIIEAHGVLSESFFVSPMSMEGLDPGARAELLQLFPGLHDDAHDFGHTAAPTLKAHEAHVALQHMFGSQSRRHAMI